MGVMTLKDPVLRKVRCQGCMNQVQIRTENFKNRPIFAIPGVVEHGIVCPMCGIWTHLSYSNPEIVELEDEIRTKKLSREDEMRKRKRLAETFRNLQIEVKAVLAR